MNNHYFKFIVLFFSVLIFNISLIAQTNNEIIEKRIQAEVDSIYHGSLRSHSYIFDSTNEQYFLDFIKKYENDTIPRVYFFIQRLRNIIGYTSKNIKIRQQVVELFINDFTSKESSVWQYALERLKNYKEKDYSEKAKKMLSLNFREGYFGIDYFFICGIAQVKEILPQLRILGLNFDRTKNGWQYTIPWYANLTLARMGDSTAKIDNMICAVELTIDSFTRINRLLPFLAYTRNADCIKLLSKYLAMNSETLPMVDGRPGVPYNQYALDYLAKYLNDFPVKYKYGILYSDEEIKIARKYLKDKYLVE